MIKLFYSSGSLVDSSFTKQPSKSIGGLMTTQSISGGVGSLFGTVSNTQIEKGAKEYRCIYVQNTDLNKEVKDIKLWINKNYTVTNQINPNSLSPNNGDKFLVPKGAIEQWLGYDGQIATFNNLLWSFELNKFANYSFSLEETAQLLNNGNSEPFGLTSTSADSTDNGTTGFFSIGDLAPLQSKPLWIYRTISKYSINEYTLLTAETPINEMLKFTESERFNISYTEMNSYKITSSNQSEYTVNELQLIPFTIALNTLGEANYSSLGLKVSLLWQGIINNSKFEADVDFMTTNYTDLNNIGNFASTNNLSEVLDLNITFLDTGIFDISVQLIDLNTENILFTKTIQIESL